MEVLPNYFIGNSMGYRLAKENLSKYWFVLELWPKNDILVAKCPSGFGVPV